jgi:hypothetical protein
MAMLSRLILVLFAASLSGWAQLREVQSVYFLPMSGSLDQYLASRLVEMRLFQVVTDPQRADAVFADRIGEGLEEKLAQLYPEQAKKPDKEEDKDKKPDFGASNTIRTSNFARGRGTLYLVDRKTHTVLWSIYSPSHTNRMPDVHKNAESIARHIATAVKEVKKQ